MAVEAHHLHLFPPQQHVPNRGVASAMENQAGVYGGAAFYPAPAPAPAFPANLVPFCHPAAVVSVDGATDSGLTFNDLSVASSSQPQKRQRGSQLQQVAAGAAGVPTFSFLGEDITSAIQQQQLEVDRLIAQHAEKVRRELWERRRQLSRQVAAAVEGWVQRRIRAKEEEIEKMGKLNTALEERVRSLFVENQIWRDLAQTNEAAANALRSDLEQVLAHATAATPAGADDAESCCDDNMGESDPAAAAGGRRRRRLCRGCWAGEPSVLLLPCRHLCLCAACGPAVVACPVCRCDKNGSVNVNMS
uniref:Apoptosis 2 inhibitor n=1 Tax=Anthurium amnicola TaxID=1678845 RepID=A0A1D1XQS5_9ARAE